MYLRMESGDEAVLGRRWAHALLIAAGDDPFALVEYAIPEAASLSGGARPLRSKQLPPSIDVFGWCSWDAFYSSVSAQGLVDAVSSLAAGGTPPKFVIIDDGWQSTDLDREFKGWQDPASSLWASASRQLSSHDEGIGTREEEARREAAREAVIEGESEMLSAILRDIPEGTATGRLLQEVKAADDVTLESIDYHTIAQQHNAGAASPAEIRALRALKQALGEKKRAGKLKKGAPEEEKPPSATGRSRRRRHGNIIFTATSAVGQYVAGLLMGALQALFLIFYQWVVDPASYGTWPVSFFSYLTSGPLRAPMLQFYADQTNFTRRLVDIKANSKFHAPDATAEAVHSGKAEDLAAVVSHLKGQLSVQFIYCWHGLSAYWSGINPDAPAMQRYRARIVYAHPPASLREIEPSMLWNPSVLAGLGAAYDPAPLFWDMHAYLAAAGVTGVKVDCQAGVGMIGSVTGGGPAVAARYHAALEDSVAAHFPANHAINCMCHSTENIYRWRHTAVARASDDFYPTDTASHTPHIAACAFNGFFLSALALPDFDMFQSRHRVAGLHAAARAVSGGPVYVSDSPGSHGFDILHQLVLPDGSVLRAKLPGRPTRDCLFADVMRDGKTLLKIWNVNVLTGVVGVFNLQGSAWDRARRRFLFHNSTPPTLTTRVSVADVEPFRAAFQQRESQKHEAVSRSSTPSDVSTQERWIQSSSQDTAAAMTNGGTNGKGAHNGSRAEGYESDVSSGAMSSDAAETAEQVTHSGRRIPARPAACGDFAVFVNSTGRLHRLPPDGGLDVSLDASHAAIVTFARVCRHHGVDFAPIGLKNMLNGGGAVVSFEVQADWHRERGAELESESEAPSGAEAYADLVAGEATTDLEGGSAMLPPLPRFHVNLRGRGTLLALCSQKPTLCNVNGYEVPFTWTAADNALEVDVPQVGRHSVQHVVVQFTRN